MGYCFQDTIGSSLNHDYEYIHNQKYFLENVVFHHIQY